MSIKNLPATAAQVDAIKSAMTKADENAPAALVFVKPKIVRATYAWRAYDGAERNTKESLFDFTAVTEEQLITLAMYAVKVKVQSVLRDAANSDPSRKIDPKLLSTVDVLKDVVQASAVKKDPVAQAILALRRAGATEDMVRGIADGLKAKK